MAIDPYYTWPAERQKAHDAKRARTTAFLLEKTPEAIKDGAERRMRTIDALPAPWRHLVHEFGPTRVFAAKERHGLHHHTRAYYELAKIELDL